MKTILIATDGSESALAAVTAGLDLAKDEGAEVVVVRVESYVEIGLRLDLSDDAPPRRLPRPTDDGVLSEALALAERYGVGATAELLIGDAPEQIARLADEIDADLVVVGSRGLTAFKQLVLGSTSSEVIRRSRRPILVIRVPEPKAA